MDQQFTQVPRTPILSSAFAVEDVSGTFSLPAMLSEEQGPPQTPLGTETHSFRRVARSASLEELQAHNVFGRLWQAPAEELPDPAQQAQNHRLAILAKKYEGTQLTREDEARVAILTQRLRRLVPRVTAKSWTMAEESVTELEDVASRVEEIRRKYGL